MWWRWFVRQFGNVVSIAILQLLSQVREVILQFVNQCMLRQQYAIYFFQRRLLVCETDFQVGYSVFHCRVIPVELIVFVGFKYRMNDLSLLAVGGQVKFALC